MLRAMRPLRTLLVLCVVTAGAAGLLTGCGDDDKPKPVTTVAPTVTTVSPEAAATARRVRTHLTLAINALRDGIQKPYEQGKFSSGGADMVLALGVAATSASTAVRELQAALSEATSESGLAGVGRQITSLLNHLTTLVGGATDGSLDINDVKPLLDDIDALGKTAGAAGIDVPQTTVPTTPGTPAP
jgi:hypothetical protein